MPCSCAATKPCPLAASPRSWTNCANPASKMSAWLPSPSARARAPDEMTYELNRSEEHTSELQSPCNLVCRLLLEKKKKKLTNGNASRKNTARRHRLVR